MVNLNTIQKHYQPPAQRLGQVGWPVKITIHNREPVRGVDLKKAGISTATKTK